MNSKKNRTESSSFSKVKNERKAKTKFIQTLTNLCQKNSSKTFKGKKNAVSSENKKNEKKSLVAGSESKKRKKRLHPKPEHETSDSDLVIVSEADSSSIDKLSLASDHLNNSPLFNADISPNHNSPVKDIHVKSIENCSSDNHTNENNLQNKKVENVTLNESSFLPESTLHKNRVSIEGSSSDVKSNFIHPSKSHLADNLETNTSTGLNSLKSNSFILLLNSALNKCKDLKENFICNELNIEPIVKPIDFNYDKSSKIFNIAVDFSVLEAANNYFKQVIEPKTECSSVFYSNEAESIDWQSNIAKPTDLTPNCIDLRGNTINECNLNVQFNSEVESDFSFTSYRTADIQLDVFDEFQDKSSLNISSNNILLDLDMNIGANEICQNNLFSENTAISEDLTPKNTVKKKRKRDIWCTKKRKCKNKNTSKIKEAENKTRDNINESEGCLTCDEDEVGDIEQCDNILLETSAAVEDLNLVEENSDVLYNGSRKRKKSNKKQKFIKKYNPISVSELFEEPEIVNKCDICDEEELKNSNSVEKCLYNLDNKDSSNKTVLHNENTIDIFQNSVNFNETNTLEEISYSPPLLNNFVSPVSVRSSARLKQKKSNLSVVNNNISKTCTAKMENTDDSYDQNDINKMAERALMYPVDSFFNSGNIHTNSEITINQDTERISAEEVVNMDSSKTNAKPQIHYINDVSKNKTTDLFTNENSANENCLNIQERNVENENSYEQDKKLIVPLQRLGEPISQIYLNSNNLPAIDFTGAEITNLISENIDISDNISSQKENLETVVLSPKKSPNNIRKKLSKPFSKNSNVKPKNNTNSELIGDAKINVETSNSVQSLDDNMLEKITCKKLTTEYLESKDMLSENCDADTQMINSNPNPSAESCILNSNLTTEHSSNNSFSCINPCSASERKNTSETKKISKKQSLFEIETCNIKIKKKSIADKKNINKNTKKSKNKTDLENKSNVESLCNDTVARITPKCNAETEISLEMKSADNTKSNLESIHNEDSLVLKSSKLSKHDHLANSPEKIVENTANSLNESMHSKKNMSNTSCQNSIEENNTQCKETEDINFNKSCVKAKSISSKNSVKNLKLEKSDLEYDKIDSVKSMPGNKNDDDDDENISCKTNVNSNSSPNIYSNESPRSDISLHLKENLPDLAIFDEDLDFEPETDTPSVIENPVKDLCTNDQFTCNQSDIPVHSDSLVEENVSVKDSSDLLNCPISNEQPNEQGSSAIKISSKFLFTKNPFTEKNSRKRDILSEDESDSDDEHSFKRPRIEKSDYIKHDSVKSDEAKVPNKLMNDSSTQNHIEPKTVKCKEIKTLEVKKRELQNNLSNTDNGNYHTFLGKSVTSDTSCNHIQSPVAEKRVSKLSSDEKRVSKLSSDEKRISKLSSDEKRVSKLSADEKSVSKLSACSNNSKEAAPHLKHFNDVLSKIKTSIDSGLINNAINIAKMYIPISGPADAKCIIKELISSFFSFILKNTNKSNSHGKTFDKILKFLNENKIDKNIASKFILQSHANPFLHIFLIKLYFLCQKNRIPVTSKAITILQNFLKSQNASLLTYLDFLKYVKKVCQKKISKEVTSIILKGCKKSSRSRIHRTCRMLSTVSQKEVSLQEVEKFLLLCFKKRLWPDIAKVFIIWCEKNDIFVYCLFNTFIAITENQALHFEKLADYLFGLASCIKFECIFGQLGTTLMLNAFYKVECEQAYQILSVLHKYNIDYFKLQLTNKIYRSKLAEDEKNNIDMLTYPYVVALSAVNICLYLKKAKDAFIIFQDFGWITPDESLSESVKSYIMKLRCEGLLKLVNSLNNEGSLNEGWEALKILLSIVEQNSTIEVNSKSLTHAYNQFLISLINSGKITSIKDLCQHSLGPRKEKLVLSFNVIRGLIAIFSEHGMFQEANAVFMMGIIQKHYSIEKPQHETFPWHMTISSNWTVHEIKLAVEWFLNALFPLLMEKQEKVEFEKWFSVKLIFKMEKQVNQKVEILKKYLSSNIEDFKVKVADTLSKMEPPLKLHEDDSKNISITPDSLYNFWKSKHSSTSLNTSPFSKIFLGTGKHQISFGKEISPNAEKSTSSSNNLQSPKSSSNSGTLLSTSTIVVSPKQKQKITPPTVSTFEKELSPRKQGKAYSPVPKFTLKLDPSEKQQKMPPLQICKTPAEAPASAVSNCVKQMSNEKKQTETSKKQIIKLSKPPLLQQPSTSYKPSKLSSNLIANESNTSAPKEYNHLKELDSKLKSNTCTASKNSNILNSESNFCSNNSQSSSSAQFSNSKIATKISLKSRTSKPVLHSTEVTKQLPIVKNKLAPVQKDDSIEALSNFRVVKTNERNKFSSSNKRVNGILKRTSSFQSLIKKEKAKIKLNKFKDYKNFVISVQSNSERRSVSNSSSLYQDNKNSIKSEPKMDSESSVVEIADSTSKIIVPETISLPTNSSKKCDNYIISVVPNTQDNEIASKQNLTSSNSNEVPFKTPVFRKPLIKRNLINSNDKEKIGYVEVRDTKNLSSQQNQNDCNSTALNKRNPQVNNPSQRTLENPAVLNKKSFSCTDEESGKIINFLQMKIKTHINLSELQLQMRAFSLATKFIENNKVTALDKKTMKLLNEFAENYLKCESNK